MEQEPAEKQRPGSNSPLPLRLPVPLLKAKTMKPNHLLIALLAVGLLSACGNKEDTSAPTPPPAASGASNPPAIATTPNAAFDKLKGQWQRPDGGYVLEIRSVEPGGKMDASYLNPRPIHVAKAEASQDGAVTKLFVELQDVNYPGSTYTLSYDAPSDRLKGVYFQAALQQRFEVDFVRIK